MCCVSKRVLWLMLEGWGNVIFLQCRGCDDLSPAVGGAPCVVTKSHEPN
uniref:Uncharacterized protein n=1 Tax=Anguilla anguilla TaxID=7936 RepID=A0A0E9SNJ0_ANGAN